MFKIRQNVYETNSSSTHSISICTSDEFEKFKKGEVYFNNYWCSSDKPIKDKLFVTLDEILASVDEYEVKEIKEAMENEDDLDYVLFNTGFQSYNNFGGDHEVYEEDYTTPGGEHIVAFGYYGQDY